ncbi:DinB family protein [Chitinophaga pendula]|uniref:DinB family protein n=1 Tax=Chitinophaga TaxID=79328 RepID=UPI000BAEDD7C|nr:MULTISPECIES: DinB family protein [Chitinophaga]ASZ10075.1 hypothetical protein CK934_03320 [Chitinophaga sp. MD30]UCJ06971.1 DinB family protein [Chitinophaga pendula]
MPAVFETTALLNELQGDVRALRDTADQTLRNTAPNLLLKAPGVGRWNAVQCLEHLNSYGRFYLPALERTIAKGEQQQRAPQPAFKSSRLGDYFTNMMLPRNDGSVSVKMQAPKEHRPGAGLDTAAVIDTFVSQQEALHALLGRAAGVNLQQLKVPTSLTRLLRLPLGDTFRFLVAHEQRHMLQAHNALVVQLITLRGF